MLNHGAPAILGERSESGLDDRYGSCRPAASLSHLDNIGIGAHRARRAPTKRSAQRADGPRPRIWLERSMLPRAQSAKWI